MRIFLSILFLISVAIIFRHVRISDTRSVAVIETKHIENAAGSPTTKDLQPTPDKTIKVEKHAVAELASNIEKLEKEKDELQHALRMQGYPDILNDDRLPESERNFLLKKLSQLTSLELRLATLKLQKIDLETEVSL